MALYPRQIGRRRLASVPSLERQSGDKDNSVVAGRTAGFGFGVGFDCGRAGVRDVRAE